MFVNYESILSGIPQVRAQVAELRKELEDLKRENDKLSPGERLTPEELEVDPGLREIIERETQDKLEEVHDAMQWETEKASIALSKIQRSRLDFGRNPHTYIYIYIHVSFPLPLLAHPLYVGIAFSRS